jgi:hypothetical protein
VSVLSPINEPEYINPDVENPAVESMSLSKLSKLSEFIY